MAAPVPGLGCLHRAHHVRCLPRPPPARLPARAGAGAAGSRRTACAACLHPLLSPWARVDTRTPACLPCLPALPSSGLTLCGTVVPIASRCAVPLPCYSAHHFQSADALAAAPVPRGTPGAERGGVLAATFDPQGVAAWLLPPAGGVERLGLNQVCVRRGVGVDGQAGPCLLRQAAASADPPHSHACHTPSRAMRLFAAPAEILPSCLPAFLPSCLPAFLPSCLPAFPPACHSPPCPPGRPPACLPAQPAALRMGGFQTLGAVYSLGLSPDARWIATGGEGGMLALYSLDLSAPPRRAPAWRPHPMPPLPAGTQGLGWQAAAGGGLGATAGCRPPRAGLQRAGPAVASGTPAASRAALPSRLALPRRPQVPPGGVQLEGSTYFYTPLMVPREGRQQGQQLLVAPLAGQLGVGRIALRELEGMEGMEGQVQAESYDEQRQKQAFLRAVLGQASGLALSSCRAAAEKLLNSADGCCSSWLGRCATSR